MGSRAPRQAKAIKHAIPTTTRGRVSLFLVVVVVVVVVVEEVGRGGRRKARRVMRRSSKRRIPLRRKWRYWKPRMVYRVPPRGGPTYDINQQA